MKIEKIKWDELAKTLCFRDSKEMLESMYERMSILEIARQLNCGTSAVLRQLQVHGIKRRARGGAKSAGAQKYKMFHVDQRVIMYLGLTVVAKELDISNSTVYTYKRWKAGGHTTSYNINRTGNETDTLEQM